MSWRTVSLGEVANVGAGNSAPQKDCLFTNGTHNFYRTSDVGRIRTGVISESSDKLNSEGIRGLKLHSIGTILFPKSGASTFLNHRVMLGKEGYVSSHLATIKAKADVADDKFLLYFLSTIDAKNLVQDSNYPSLKTSVIEKISFSLPPLTVQKKIVTKLNAIFAEIDKATAAAEANAKNSYALYSSAVDSIFGKLTDKNVKLSSCSDIGYGYTSKSSSEFLGPQYLRITDIQDDSVDWLLVPKINEKSSDVGKFILKDGDIVFARTGATTGKSYLIKEPPISVFASYLIRVDANRNYVEPEYLRHFFRSDDYWTAINAGISGAAQGGFNASKLGELSFPLPDLTIQKKIIEKLDVIEAHSTIVKKSQENKVKELKLLRQSILKQAFNGDLVKE